MMLLWFGCGFRSFFFFVPATFGQTAKLEEYVQMMERQRTFPDYAFTKMLESARELCQENAAKRQQ